MDETAAPAAAETPAEVAAPVQEPVEPIPDKQWMVDQCLAAIKECVGRFSHFYKGHYRLAYYYFHSKTSRNIEACRELLFGRPLSATLAHMQQQQGIIHPRFLPIGIAGLFAEWRYVFIQIHFSNIIPL